MSAVGALQTVRPGDLRANRVEALFVEGWAFDQRHEVRSASLRIGASTLPALAIGIARPEIAERHRGGPLRSPYAATSGLMFAGPVGPFEPGTVPFELELLLSTGETVCALEGRLTVAPEIDPPAVVVPPADVAIVMATYNPTQELFRRQIDSIRAQQHRSWVCLVCDDSSTGEHLSGMREVLGDDDRFVLIEHRKRLGFYLNFERALAAVPATASYVALSDQDDRWHPDKLLRQVAILDDQANVQLVASDVRVTDPEGSERSPTFYLHRTPTHDHPYSLFLVNSLIGASMVFRRNVLDVALPFPRAFEDRYHDHWLARTALVTGDLAFVSEPLHDYVQHESNVLGDRQATQVPLGSVLKPVLRSLAGGASLPDAWRHDFVNFALECSVTAELLRARCPSAAAHPWLARIVSLQDGQLRELSQILVDHARERRMERRRRENVEIALFTGRSWVMDHRPQPTPT